MHPFSGDPLRCWPLERWLALLPWLLDQGFERILLVASPSEREEHAGGLERFQKSLGTRLIFSQNLVADLASCALFVGSDSGPLHLASALGIPSLGLYLDEKAAYHPRGQGRVVILSRPSLEQIQVLEVLEALKCLRARM